MDRWTSNSLEWISTKQVIVTSEVTSSWPTWKGEIWRRKGKNNKVCIIKVGVGIREVIYITYRDAPH
jgi:hypothetical protein